MIRWSGTLVQSAVHAVAAFDHAATDAEGFQHLLPGHAMGVDEADPDAAPVPGRRPQRVQGRAVRGTAGCPANPASAPVAAASAPRAPAAARRPARCPGRPGRRCAAVARSAVPRSLRSTTAPPVSSAAGAEAGCAQAVHELGQWGGDTATVGAIRRSSRASLPRSRRAPRRPAPRRPRRNDAAAPSREPARAGARRRRRGTSGPAAPASGSAWRTAGAARRPLAPGVERADAGSVNR